MATIRAICQGKELRLSCLKGNLRMLQTLESRLRRRLSEDTVALDTRGMDTLGADPAGIFLCTNMCTAHLWRFKQLKWWPIPMLTIVPPERPLKEIGAADSAGLSTVPVAYTDRHRYMQAKRHRSRMLMQFSSNQWPLL